MLPALQTYVCKAYVCKAYYVRDLKIRISICVFFLQWATEIQTGQIIVGKVLSNFCLVKGTDDIYKQNREHQFEHEVMKKN
jgi:hypothetical protein